MSASAMSASAVYASAVYAIIVLRDASFDEISLASMAVLSVTCKGFHQELSEAVGTKKVKVDRLTMLTSAMLRAHLNSGRNRFVLNWFKAVVTDPAQSLFEDKSVIYETRKKLHHCTHEEKRVPTHPCYICGTLRLALDRAKGLEKSIADAAKYHKKMCLFHS